MKTSPGGSGSLETAVGAEAAGAVPKPSKGRMTSGAEAPVAVQSPTFDPISQVAAGLVTEDLKLALRLKEVELEAKAKEVELMHLRIRAMELDPSRARDATPVPVSTLPDTSTVDQFNASKQIVLVPPFREGEVDSYFTAFERIATTLKWPKDVWSLLLQCKLVGRAQEVCASLSIADSLDYEVVKATILRAYELVPEAYRQKFRACSKSDSQTFVEFAREKAVLFDKWLAASKVNNFTQLKELILLEFKTCLPENIVVYLNEQVELLSKAAVLADEFVLTHRAALSTARREYASPTQHAKSYRVSPKRQTRSAAIPVSDRKCFYCHEIGHLVAACPSLQRKEQAHTVRKPKSVGFVRSMSASTSPDNEVRSESLDDSYRPFVSEGFVSLNGKEEDRVPITILRDTGAAQTLILRGILPFSDFSFCGSDALVWGVKMDVLRVPLHKVFLQSPLVSGPVTVGVRDHLPVPGVVMILGNDLANGKVFSAPRVVENPVPDTLLSDLAAGRSPSVFPACAVTRAHKRKYGDVDLSDSFLCAGGEPESESKPCDPLMGDSEAMLSISPSVTSQLPSGVNKKDFVLAQHSDPTLVGCFSAAHSSDQYPRVYSVEDDVLMRTWFEPVTLSFLKETVGRLKPAGSPNDAVPPRLLKEVLPTVGPLVLELTKKQQESPEYFVEENELEPTFVHLAPLPMELRVEKSLSPRQSFPSGEEEKLPPTSTPEMESAGEALLGSQREEPLEFDADETSEKDLLKILPEPILETVSTDLSDPEVSDDLTAEPSPVTLPTLNSSDSVIDAPLRRSTRHRSPPRRLQYAHLGNPLISVVQSLLHSLSDALTTTTINSNSSVIHIV
ncbi:unnamed protein product [Oreochromis niloticus]|nr:unnamed protein product [Mustela putorius furo]